MLPCTYEPEGFEPLYVLPCPQEEIVFVPPARATAPVVEPTATGVLINLALLITIEPADAPEFVVDVRTNTPVFLTVASMIAVAPAVYVDCK